MSKNFEKVKSLVHPNYTLKDPMMTLNSADELIAMMKSCPFDSKIENLAVIGDGNKVVSTFDCVGTKPVASRLRMCSVATVEGGKVRSEEMFYDSAKIPQELKDQMKNLAGGKQKAA